MKLEEDLKAVRYIREYIDLTVSEDGFVMLPAWQFARFVDEYQSYRHSTIMWFAMFLLLVVVLIFFPMILR